MAYDRKQGGHQVAQANRPDYRLEIGHAEMKRTELYHRMRRFMTSYDFFVLPATPSDVRAVANTRAGMRRILREDGLLIEEAPKAEAKPRPLSLEQRVTRLEQRLERLAEKLSQ